VRPAASEPSGLSEETMSVKSLRRVWIALTSSLVSALLLGLAASAAPAPVEGQRRLRATLVITQAAIPRDLSEAALLRFARGHASKIMNETDEADIATRRWPGNLIVQFTSAPSDIEFHALFYDIEDGPRNFVDDMSIYVHDDSQRTYVQRLNLARPRFRPNRRMEMVVTVRHEEVGTLRFELRGEEIRRSGMVDFTDEEGGGED
jgi:hypothetical protein